MILGSTPWVRGHGPPSCTGADCTTGPYRALCAVTDTRLFELADGRELAWAEFGVRDGAPGVAFHGSTDLAFTLRV